MMYHVELTERDLHALITALDREIMDLDSVAQDVEPDDAMCKAFERSMQRLSTVRHKLSEVLYGYIG